MFLTLYVPSNCLRLGVLLIGGIEGESHNENVRLESISSTHGDGGDAYIELGAGFTIYYDTKGGKVILCYCR